MSRRFSMVPPFLAVFALLLIPARAQPAPPVVSAAPPLEAGLATITEESLRASLLFLASDELEGRDTPSVGLDKAGTWLADRFRDGGLAPAFGDSYFQVGPAPKRRRNQPDDEALGSLPPPRNVGALLLGSDPALRDEVVVFSAHYDHVGMDPRREGDRIFNGADDDATGTAAVLALARAVAKLPVAPKRTTLFLCFYGEEKGFVGSRHYCENPAIPLVRTRAVFNLEMLGRPDDIAKNEAWVTGFDVSDFGALIAESAKEAGIRFYERGRESRMLFSASDNIEFAKRGVPAHSISAGSLHGDYHKPSDEVAKLDIPNMTAVVKGIFVAGVRMADGGTVPTFKEGSSYAKRAAELRDGPARPAEPAGGAPTGGGK